MQGSFSSPLLGFRNSKFANLEAWQEFFFEILRDFYTQPGRSCAPTPYVGHIHD